MKKIILFLMFSVSLIAQRVELIKLNGNIKDKNSRTKSLTFIDNRTDKFIGTIADKKETAEIKFENEDLKNYIENWFLNDNKKLGNTDVVVMLEELKIYDEQNENKDYPFAKLKIKMSSFLKRIDRYYFMSRFDNVIVCNPKLTTHPQRFLAPQIADIMTEFIKLSYSYSVTGAYIPENEINNYDKYLSQNYKAFNNYELKDGVYNDFKGFYNQEPNAQYSIKKNKKGKVTGLLHNGADVSYSEMYCYVDGGKAYKLTPVGFDEMKKDDKGFYIYTSRVNLFAGGKGSGIIVGAVLGGIPGALIGAAIESGTNPPNGAVQGIGYRSSQESNVYIDSLTGAYIFEK
ncbi:hypothetical protein SAMN05443633_11641 [Chryseobacterium arachidis]|uniref:Glycine zipper n=1 Tax=Chryseobacterium arachidis TaxID=1416778 RepID=A0A1M5K6S1_9FLAO|nr:hypothetical protein [Chryseobacterium arachidis]SHG48476.1 hypothetical protein SAMN05443633_11641 [Chryseobacterium arachidis]